MTTIRHNTDLDAPEVWQARVDLAACFRAADSSEPSSSALIYSPSAYCSTSAKNGSSVAGGFSSFLWYHAVAAYVGSASA